MPGSEIAARIDETWNFLQENVWTNLSGQISILESLLQFYGERHYYVMELKRRIIELIGGDDNSYDIVDEGILEKKLLYCKQHLKLCDILTPGLTECRAYISFHYAETLHAMMSRGLMECDPEVLASLVNHLDTVIRIWSDYRQGSIEREKVELAEILKQEINSQLPANINSCSVDSVRKFA